MRELCRMDVARWLVPGEITDPSKVTFKRAMMLTYRHMGLRAVLAMRFAGWLKRRGVPGGPSFMQRLILRRYGMDVVIGATYGGGLYVAHPVGVTLAPNYMGENCSIIASITIGLRGPREFPKIGDRVFIGAGCRVLGAITVGDDAMLGANSVVINDVPAGATMVGVPAKPLKQS